MLDRKLIIWTSVLLIMGTIIILGNSDVERRTVNHGEKFQPAKEPIRIVCGGLNTTEERVDLFIAITKEPKVGKVKKAIESLGEMGRDAKRALFDLEVLLGHPNEEVRQAAIQAIEEITSAAKPIDAATWGVQF